MPYFNKEKCSGFIQLMRLDKPIGSLLLLWPTLWALFAATQGIPSFELLCIFIAGVWIMRSAGCVINDYADRHIDGNVKRTAQRPLATGKISEKEAKILFIALLMMAFMLDLALNRYAFLLSFIAVLLAIIYPFMKRFTHLPQVILGMAFGWSIPMAYGATIEHLPIECWLLFFANLAWTVAYDTQYAMVDRDDDLRIGVKSTAILFAQYDNKIIALLQTLTLILMTLFGVISHYTWAYFAILSLTSFLFIYQCHLTKERVRENCFKAFLNNNYVGFGFFVAICVGIFFQ